MHQGLYVIFEGIDGSGKSTAMQGVAEALGDRLQIKQTHHPGSTPLGAHIRKLVKFPHEIDPNIQIDDLSRQILYMVDTVSFIKSILEPSLEAGKTIFADRSSLISAIVYSLADGLNIEDVQRLSQLMISPKADRLYILQCSCDIGKERVQSSRVGTEDHYDKKSMLFFKKVQDIYDHLITGSAEQTILVSRVVALENIIYIDATQSPQKVVQDIAEDLDRILAVRFNV